MKGLVQWATVLAMAASASSLHAIERGTTGQQLRYVSGGVGLGEIELLQAERRRYSVKVVTAVRRSGEFIAGSRVVVTDPFRRVVFDGELDGPWLLIDLPPGRYRLRVSHGMNSQVQALSIDAGQMRDLLFYFDPDPTGDLIERP